MAKPFFKVKRSPLHPDASELIGGTNHARDFCEYMVEPPPAQVRLRARRKSDEVAVCVSYGCDQLFATDIPVPVQNLDP